MTQTTTQTGAVIGNAARARMSADYFAPTNVWSAVVVRSGERKSPVLRAVMQPLHTRQDKAAEEHAQAMAEYESELEKWRRLETKVRRVRDRPVEPGSYPHLFLSGTTTEAIMQRLVEQRRGLAVVLVELSGFFSGMNQYRTKGGNDREAYLAFYDAGAAKIDRKSATPPTIYVPRAFVTFGFEDLLARVKQHLPPAETMGKSGRLSPPRRVPSGGGRLRGLMPR